MLLTKIHRWRSDVCKILWTSLWIIITRFLIEDEILIHIEWGGRVFTLDSPYAIVIDEWMCVCIYALIRTKIIALFFRFISQLMMTRCCRRRRRQWWRRRQQQNNNNNNKKRNYYEMKRHALAMDLEVETL